LGGRRTSVYAHFMRDNVHHRLGIKQSGWSSLDQYTASMSNKFWGRVNTMYQA